LVRFITLGGLARLDHEQGQAVSARALYDQAIRGLREVVAHAFYESQLLAALGALLADAGEISGAERAFAEAEAVASPTESRTAQLTAALHRGHLDLARARQAEERGDVEAATRHRSAAQERLHAPVPRAMEARFARRMLERALSAPHASSPPIPRGALVVSQDAAECRVPDGRAVDLRNHPKLQKLLLALVDARLNAPGQAVKIQALFDAAWRGEQALHESIRNRVYTAVRRLRRAGLEGLVLNDIDGYLLDPEVKVVHDSRPPG
jgi:hypothetical protein